MKAILGTGWSFPPRFEKGATGAGVSTVSDEQDIRESLRILFGTQRGERALQPRYGLDMQELLFESVSTTMRTLLAERVRISILIYEPRIEPLDVRIASPDPHAGALNIELDYRVRSTNSRFNLVFPFYRSDSNELARTASLALQSERPA